MFMGELQSYLRTPEFLSLTPLHFCSMSHFRCLELLFRATPKDTEQGDLDSQFSSFLVEVVVVDISSLSVCPSPLGN